MKHRINFNLKKRVTGGLALNPPETSLFLSSVTGSYVGEECQEMLPLGTSSKTFLWGSKKGSFLSRPPGKLSGWAENCRRTSLKNHNSIPPTVHLLIKLEPSTEKVLTIARKYANKNHCNQLIQIFNRFRFSQTFSAGTWCRSWSWAQIPTWSVCKSLNNNNNDNNAE